MKKLLKLQVSSVNFSMLAIVISVVDSSLLFVSSSHLRKKTRQDFQLQQVPALLNGPQ